MRLARSDAPDTIDDTATTHVTETLDQLPDRWLEPAELGSLVGALGADPGITALAGSLQPADGARQWMMVHRDANVDVWLIVWKRGADTGWHDHDRSGGALYVLGGKVVEWYAGPAGRPERRRLEAGRGTSFGPEHVHRVTASAVRSVTVHAYSPPLQRMGRYTVDTDGALRWQSVGYDNDLEVG